MANVRKGQSNMSRSIHNPGKLEEMYDLYSKLVYGMIYNLIKNRVETDDLFQNLWVKVLENQDKFDQPAGHMKTKNYLKIMTRNLVYDYFHAQSNEKNNLNYIEDLVNELAIEDITQERILPYGLAEEQLREILATLPREDKELLYLKEVAGKSYKEIGEMTGKSETAMRMKLSRIKKRLREIIENLERGAEL